MLYIEHSFVLNIHKVNNNLKSHFRFCVIYGFSVYCTFIYKCLFVIDAIY